VLELAGALYAHLLGHHIRSSTGRFSFLPKVSRVHTSIFRVTVNAMPKLYYTPTSCGAASFISAFIAGVAMEAEQVNLQEHKTDSGADFFGINKKGNVPCIVLDDGTVLNEGAATLQWIADQQPGSVAPENGSTERYVVVQLLNYVASELHASVGTLFSQTITPEIRAFAEGNYRKKLAFANENVIAGKDYLLGDKFSIADSYFYIVLTWSPYVKIDLAEFPNLQV
jgi:glutathione S-transferase